MAAHLCVGLSSHYIARCIAHTYLGHIKKWLNCRHCGTDTSTSVPNSLDNSDPSRWCWIVLGPNCLVSEVSVPGLWSRSRHFGLEMVSRRISVWSWSRLDKICQRLGLGKLTSRSRLGFGHWRFMPETNFPSNFARHNNKVNQVSCRC